MSRVGVGTTTDEVFDIFNDALLRQRGLSKYSRCRRSGTSTSSSIGVESSRYRQAALIKIVAIGVDLFDVVVRRKWF